MSAPTASYVFSASEQPIFDGGPFAPAHRTARRLAYLVAGLLVGLSAQFGHALTLVNLPIIAGDLGLSMPQAGWLLAIYVAANCSANLLLVRARTQHGIPSITLGLLVLYAGAALAQLALPGAAMALVVRLMSGFVSASLTTITIYYMLQLVPPARRPLALMVGVTLTQLAVPLARLVPVDMVISGPWQGAPLIELGVALTMFSLLLALPLPPSIRDKGIEGLDALSFALVFVGLLLLCGAIASGRGLWWTDAPWIGAALAAGIALLTVALALERHRSRPLLLTSWIFSRPILRYVAIALLVRFALAEQTYGAVGLLNATGLNNDQLRSLFLVVLAAMSAGLVAAVWIWTPTRTFTQILCAALAIAAGAWMDSGSSSLTRLPELYVSQALLGFGACLFIGPALIFGFGQVLQLGRDHFVSMVVAFGISQNIGGLLGASLLGSFQVARAKVHAAALSEHLLSGDPQVMARLTQQGATGLYASLQREASVLAFNDVFQLVAAIAALTALYVALPSAVAGVRSIRARLSRPLSSQP